MQESSGQKSIEGEDGIWAWDVLEKRKGIHNDSNEKHSRGSSSCSSSSSSRSSSLSQEYSTRHNSRSPLNRERKTRRRCSDDTDRSDSEERTRRDIPNRSKMNVSNKTTRKFRKHSSSKSPSRSPSCEESSLERKNVKRSKCARSRSPSNDKNIEKIEVNQKLIKSSGENTLNTSFRENRSKERSCSIDPKGDKFDVAEHSYRKREVVPGSHVNNKDKEPNRDKRKGDKVKARSRSKSKDKKLRSHKSRSRSCSVGRRSRSRSKGRSSRIRRANSPRRRSRSHSRGHYYRRKSSPRRRRSRSRERRSRSRGRCQRSRSRDKHRSRYHHYRSTSRDRYRSHHYSRSRSRSRSHSRLSSREKTKEIGSSSKKLVSLPLSTSTGAMTPQMALQQAMAQMSAKAQALTGIALPTYYNPAAVNPLKYAEQVQKRQLLWPKKKKTEEQNKGTVWDKMTFAQDQDGRMTAKFRKLMGIKGEENAEQPPDENFVKDEDVVKKQEELFRNLDQQYEMARMSTHTHRGVGLGYTSQAIYPPIQK